MSSLLDSLLEGPSSDQLPQSLSLPMQGCARTAVLITHSELTELVRQLRQFLDSLEEGSTDRKSLETLLENVPQVEALAAMHRTPTSTPHATPPGTPPLHKRNPRGTFLVFSS